MKNVTSTSEDALRRVPLTLPPYAMNGSTDPLELQLNDYAATIPRGREVMIPYYVYLHIQEMLEQDMRTAERIRQLTL